MKALLLLSGAVITVAGACFGVAGQDEPKAKPAAAPAAKADNKPADTEKADKAKDATADEAHNDAKAADTEHTSSVPTKYAADEKAIRDIHEKLVKAYSADDAKAVTQLFSEEGEYINAAGELFQGREDLENSLADFMREHSGCQLESDISDIRFLGPTIAMVDGVTTVNHAEEAGTTHCKFHAVYSKTDGKWQIASIQDRMAKQETSHEDHLAALDFLKGEWVDEDQHSVVSFNCHPADNGKFLVRDFTLKVAGQELMSGSQRIGWDPLNGHIRTWIFDSEGGFGEGTWQQRGENQWVVQAAGVTADGRVASGTSVYKIINNHTMTWQQVDYEVDGTPIADSPVFTLTHRAPSPGTAEDEGKLGLKTESK